MISHFLVLLLGCQNNYLLDGRIRTAIDFALNIKENHQIDWFLSGGIKNPQESTQSEAHKMSEIISNTDIIGYGNLNENWNYIYDTVSTNTVENFMMAKQVIDENPGKYSKVYVVTSDFHHDRASKIADKVVKDNNFNWILSNLELHDSRYWETVHVKNIDSDINKIVSQIKNTK